MQVAAAGSAPIRVRPPAAGPSRERDGLSYVLMATMSARCTANGAFRPLATLQRLVFIVLLTSVSCVAPERPREAIEAERKEFRRRVEEWKANALTATELCQYYASRDKDTKNSDPLQSKVISVKGQIKNIKWENGTAEVALAPGPGFTGGVTCVIQKRTPSVQIIKDFDYTKEICLLGKLETGLRMPVQLPGKDPESKWVIVLLTDCEVL